jgi:hypothetical protein
MGEELSADYTDYADKKAKNFGVGRAFAKRLT